MGVESYFESYSISNIFETHMKKSRPIYFGVALSIDCREELDTSSLN